MKKAIIATDIVASSMLYSNTVEAINNIKNNNKNDTTSVYHWTVETELNVFTGTCKSIAEVNKEITKVTQESKIIKKNITPLSQIDSDLDTSETVYHWNVTTINGHSFGTSTSLEEAQSFLESLKESDIIKSSIEQSINKLK